MDFCKNYPLPDWTSGFEHRKTTASQLPYEEYTGPMDKSAGDTNDYKLIRLPNNLVVMCVQDPATETAAAALSVNVGSNMDPVELQGLAHFLEHMLFMGTEKYPNEDEYKTYISEHSGSYNASTSFSRTRYHFGIANDAFEGALDRLSSFFTSPLFKKDCVDRELCAVDSEYKGLLNSDFWRSHQIGCKLSDPDHPYSKFMVGNIEVLKQGAKDHGLDLYEELLKFYNKYYSSDIMKLVICGNHSLDQLVEWAVSKFSDIKSKGDNVQRDLGHPVNAEFLGKVIHIETVDDMHTMSMHFPVPDTKAMYRSDPFDYISHFLGYKGQGSIIAYLKQQGWATSLSVGSDTAYNSGFCEFGISISATPEGLEHYEDILRSVFAYLRMLISSGPQEWAQQEKSSMLKIGFDNRTKTRALVCVLGYTHLIHNEYVAPEHVLSKDSAYEKFNYDDILHCLSFINPDNFRVFLCAAKHKSIECSEVEPYFGGAYHVDSLSVDLIRELASDTIHVDGLSLPERNLFIPDDFSIKSTNMLGVAAVLRPTLLKLNDNFELWFKQDDQYITGTSEWHHQLLESELAKITPAKLQAHIDSLFDVTYTKMCMVGNFDEAEALKVSDDVQAVIKPTPNLGYNLSKPRSYDIEPGYYIYQMQVPNEDCVNSAVLSNIYCGPTTDKREAAMLEILETLVHDGFFAQLRTKHQLGYKVSASCEIFPVGRSELALRVESESNPMYVTLHINKFIYDMQQRLLDMTDEQFNNRVQSLVMQYQEGVKNISHEAGKYSFEVKTGTYNFGKNIAMANLLQSIAKEELLAFWNKYINPSTAPAYTRIDVQTWSTKIWKPSVSDIKTYSAKTLALYGCLHSEGNDALDIGKVDEFITAAIATRKKQPEASDSTDTLLADLKSASMSASGAMYTAGESAERATHTGTALELAIKGHGTFGNYANVSHTNFATIGMDKTPDGLWLMTDYRKFQATQKMYGSELPAEVLVPKYNS
ncbi:metalloprotease [Coemansia aciculifera]|nr:metalloprotease [Coemansia aciculifera]